MKASVLCSGCGELLDVLLAEWKPGTPGEDGGITVTVKEHDCQRIQVLVCPGSHLVVPSVENRFVVGGYWGICTDCNCIVVGVRKMDSGDNVLLVEHPTVPEPLRSMPRTGREIRMEQVELDAST